MIEKAGELKIPFTSGILIGIGETRIERIEALLALRELHDKYGHIQEIIIQNFKAKPRTPMQFHPEPELQEILWTVAIARILFGPEMNIQTPPNLNANNLDQIVAAGVNDWGGISPLTPDHVNPEAPWPQLEKLSKQMEHLGRVLTQRLAIYPSYAVNHQTWINNEVLPKMLQLVDQQGFARMDQWCAGESCFSPIQQKKSSASVTHTDKTINRILKKVSEGCDLEENEVIQLLNVRGKDFFQVCEAADDLRRKASGDEVTYVVNRNINYTNVCYFRCGFCAFSKGKMSENLRGKPYNLNLEEIVDRSKEAWNRGASEICLQGGIHPHYTGTTYLDICEAIKNELPDIHIHAFSPLEVSQGAKTLNLRIPDFLLKLKEAGLGTLPGTAAEILDDEVRRIICPDKLTTDEWLEVMRHAHEVGFKTSSTIMFGHIEQPKHVARHLHRIRDLQRSTGGFTEFVPLPFVHMESPIYLKGKARKGPTFREAVLIHAVARLVLHPLIQNIQTSWVKMGHDGARFCLNSGVNDLGGTLMNESITRAAGTVHGQEMLPEWMESLIQGAGRHPKQRDTLYSEAESDQKQKSYGNPQLVKGPAQFLINSGEKSSIRPLN
jgi:FO synthase